MRSNGFSAIILIVAVVLVIIGFGAAYLYFQKDSATIVIRPNDKPSIKSTKANPDAKLPNPEIADTAKSNQENSETIKLNPTIKSKVVSSVIDEKGVATYTNESFHFSVQHPKNYVFEEKIRNYYNVNSVEDSSELVYVYTLSNPELSATSGNPGDKILITVYQPGYEPIIEADQNSKTETLTVAGQKTQKQFSREGKFITVGPLLNENKKFTIQYEMPSALTDQSFFTAVLSSFKFNAAPSE